MFVWRWIIRFPLVLEVGEVESCHFVLESFYITTLICSNVHPMSYITAFMAYVRVYNSFIFIQWMFLIPLSTDTVGFHTIFLIPVQYALSYWSLNLIR